jgi:hypothetical protein
MWEAGGAQQSAQASHAIDIATVVPTVAALRHRKTLARGVPLCVLQS